MEDFLNVATFFISATAIYFVVRSLWTFISILRFAYWGTKITLLRQPQLDADQQEAVDELCSFGFSPVSMDRIEYGPNNHDGMFFRHTEYEAFAFLFSAETGFQAEFYSFASDGKVFLTYNRSILFFHGMPRNWSPLMLRRLPWLSIVAPSPQTAPATV